MIIQNLWHLEAFRQTLKQVIRWQEPDPVVAGQESAGNQLFKELFLLCRKILQASEEEELQVDPLKLPLCAEMNENRLLNRK